MIIENLIIGSDKKGHPLKCGDICKFNIKLQRRKSTTEQEEEMLGMIIYDPDSYAYAFETLDDYAPILCMYCAEYGSIEKLFEANHETFHKITDGDKWREIYNNNAMIK